jgi:hypothetical protein
MEVNEKRKFKRLQIKLDLLCHKAYSTVKESHIGCTTNVSPGGLYFETETDVFKPGNLLTVELLIPPTTGLLQFGGSISGLGKVLRTHTISSHQKDTENSSVRSGIALEFCQPLNFACESSYYGKIPSNTSTAGPVI